MIRPKAFVGLDVKDMSRRMTSWVGDPFAMGHKTDTTLVEVLARHNLHIMLKATRKERKGWTQFQRIYRQLYAVRGIGL